MDNTTSPSVSVRGGFPFMDMEGLATRRCDLPASRPRPFSPRPAASNMQLQLWPASAQHSTVRMFFSSAPSLLFAASTSFVASATASIPWPPLPFPPPLPEGTTVLAFSPLMLTLLGHVADTAESTMPPCHRPTTSFSMGFCRLMGAWCSYVAVAHMLPSHSLVRF